MRGKRRNTEDFRENTLPDPILVGARQVHSTYNTKHETSRKLQASVTTTCPYTVILRDERYIWWGVLVMGEEAELVGGRGCKGYLCTILSILQ